MGVSRRGGDRDLNASNRSSVGGEASPSVAVGRNGQAAVTCALRAEEASEQGNRINAVSGEEDDTDQSTMFAELR